MNIPRVALISLHFAEYSLNLARALSESCNVLLVMYVDNAVNELGKDWEFGSNPQKLKVVLVDRPRSLFSVLKNAKQLVLAIKEFSPTVVHFQEDPRDELIISLPFLRKFPTVLTVHDPSPHSGTDMNRFRFSRLRVFRNILRRFADVAITHGSMLCELLENVEPRFRGRSFSVPHGPLGILRGSPPVALSKGCRLLFFGRIHEYKGLRYFVDSVIELKNRGFPVVGVVAGRGGDLDRYRQRMQGAGCFEILDRYIASEDVPSLFLDSFAVVLPYTDGTQSGVAAMALGFGRPVVASAVGSIPELVRDNVNGLLVPAMDSPALVEALSSLIVDQVLWEKLVSGARKLRDDELSWGAIAHKTSDIYSVVAEMRAGG